MTHVAEPLFVEWDHFSATSNSRTLLDNLRHNRGQWQSITLHEKSSATTAKTAAQAVTEINSETLEQTAQVNGEQLDERKHANPSLVDGDSSEAGRSFQRRYSLPVGTSIRTSTGRRLSLPNGYPSVSSVISRLTRLCESSHASEDACNSVKKSKIRRCSLEDSTAEQTMSYCSKQRSPEYTENNQDSQKLCTGLENNHSLHLQEIDFCTNVGRTNGKRLEDGALPCYKKNVCQPESEHSCSNRWQMARKMSLISPKDQQMMTVIVGRKRSRSLVTSTLVCTFEDNRNTTALQSLETNLLNGLVQAERVIDTSSWGRWLAWWQKKTKNHFCTSKLPPEPLNADAYHCHLPGQYMLYNILVA